MSDLSLLDNPYSPLSFIVLEQLPISIHRSFTLIQELDQQAQGLSYLQRLPLSYLTSCRTDIQPHSYYPRVCRTTTVIGRSAG